MPSALSDIIAANGGSIPTPDELAAKRARKDALDAAVQSIDDVGDYKPEADDDNVLIYGPWLERGGSAFWVSTAGVGKSISSVQMAHAMSDGREFCGLRPRGKLRFWIFQSEDSPRRVALDREDVRAELSEEYPDVDWSKSGENVRVCKLTGKVGVAFLDELDRLLTLAAEFGKKPDVIILNPFLAFVGGPITDGSYVTPFLRGGTIDGKETAGLQALLERHAVGVLIFHHTPKPPSEKEIDAWMKSAFPEYQGAGSSDITNWGRSFVTMMRVKGRPNMVCVTAGKNGAELGWDFIGGAYRRYMAYSNEKSALSGKGRHAWRELTDEEFEEVVGDAAKTDEKAVEDARIKTASAILTAEVAPIASRKAIKALMSGCGIRRDIITLVAGEIIAKPDAFGLLTMRIQHNGGVWMDHIGSADGLERAKECQSIRRQNAQDSADY